MPIPSEIAFLIERLTQELARIEQETIEGLNLANNYYTAFLIMQY